MASNKLPTPTPPAKPVTIAILGAGNRGTGYAAYAKLYPEWLKVVAVCDKHDFKCRRIQKDYDIPDENVFIGDWSLLMSRPRICDAVAICTTDREHAKPAVALAKLKYNILLEKPMSVSVDECVQIYEAVVANNVILAVGHVLRYTDYTTELMRVLESNVLGKIVNIQHLEPVGFWHFAHSFVRGNWHNENESTFSLLAKSCHDVDLIAYMMNSKCTKISSFGNLLHFKKENKPAEAGDAKNCLDCPYERSCPYSAKQIYLDAFAKSGRTGWPMHVVQPHGDIDIENLTAALRKGDYGKCVYEMNNDVCDHQVVNMEFENGATASFTMIAFTEEICQRKTKIFGTLGELEGDGIDTLKVFDFLTRETKIIHPSKEVATSDVPLPESGHGGGDFGLMRAFLNACVTGNQAYVTSGPKDTLDSHIYVFAAEHARRSGTVVNIDDYKKDTLKMQL
jgi:predicted dehydrogenase